MGNLCCLGRLDKYRKNYEDFEGKIIDALASYPPISGALGLDDDDDEGDFAEFNTAYENADIPKLVRLCYSTTPLEQYKQAIHPWAATPETIGALAASRLAHYASLKHQPEFKDDIRLAGGVEVLVDLLGSTVGGGKPQEVDRVHAAAIALAFLSSGCTFRSRAAPECCEQLYALNVFPTLIAGMKSSPDSFRAVCAQTCRNVYHLDVQYREKFMDLGGLAAMVSLLDPIDDSGDHYLTQLDVVYHLTDFIMVCAANAQDGIEENPYLLRCVQASGALAKLRPLEKAKSEELSKAARSLIAHLDD